MTDIAMSDAIPDEAFPERLNIFRRDRRMTFNDHVNRDPVDWCDYIRKDIADAAVKAARELEDGLGRKSVHVGSLRLKLWRALNDYDAAAIRKGERP